jgi:uncharacterized circularly permuted ATP-grasp superfamily protein
VAATTHHHELPPGGAGYDPEDFYDEAFAAPGRPRPAYLPLFAQLATRDLGRLEREIHDRMLDEGCTFGEGDDAGAFRVDPLPRVLTHEEWAPLAAGLEQRVRALDAFIADVYGPCRIVREGVVPERVIDGAEYFERSLAALAPARVHVGVAGLDVVRSPSGEFRVLEDNLRTPSGLAYMFSARTVAGDLFPLDGVSPVVERTAELLGCALRAAAPSDADDVRVALLTDGPHNSAYWEHAQLAELLDVPLVTPETLDLDQVDVVYRRTNDDRLIGEDGGLTDVGAALLPGLRDGHVAVVNGLGNGIADDKLVHAYVEDMVRFYLGEEPLVPSVRTYDLANAACRAEVLDRLAEMVIKPRAAYGGVGVFVGPQAGPEERDRVAGEVTADPEAWIAQETVFFSRHPTVVDGAIAPRHVDLRAFVTFDGERAAAVPGGLTRFAAQEGELVVNSSQGGGGKDTWVLR